MKTITFLLVLLCVTTLNGMNKSELDNCTWEKIPHEVKSTIVTYVNKYNNLDDVIDTIKAIRLTSNELNKIVHDKWGNQAGFGTFVHVLAKKFDTGTFNIAKKFNTPVARQYMGLGEPVKDNTVIYLKIIENSAYGALLISVLLIFVPYLMA